MQLRSGRNGRAIQPVQEIPTPQVIWNDDRDAPVWDPEAPSAAISGHAPRFTVNGGWPVRLITLVAAKRSIE